MKILTLKTSRRGERGREMSDDEDSDFEDIKKRGKRREMRDIDEDSDIEDNKKRGKGTEMSDSDEDSDFQDMKIVNIEDMTRIKRGERGER